VSKFKVGQVVVGFDGKEMFKGVVRNIGKDEVNIGNNITSRWFLNNYVYPSGTTIEIKEPKVRGGWFNRVENKVSSCGFIVWDGGGTQEEAMEFRKRNSYKYLGPPIYIEAKEGSAPTTITITEAEDGQD